MDKAWIKRLILLDAVLVAVLGWLGYTVWVEAKEARAAKRAGSAASSPATPGVAPAAAPAADVQAPGQATGQSSDGSAVDGAGPR